MRLRSPAFEDGERIPEKHGYTDENVSPPLSFEDVPRSAESLALVMDDPDAVEPAGKVWDHWVVWNIGAGTTEVPEGWNPEDDGAVEGQNDYGETGYGGPNPPDGEHTYVFKLYSLDTTLDLSGDAKKSDLEDAIKGHVTQKAELRGTYAP
ncbi:MAG: YbhB/YbcL family Raf kinase inhibitor-like protein [Halobacteria archaeon]|nr:YbhB/YbcL family Raf kinase inhibitor-like protein [Halobacteria archaeon]